MRLLFSIISLLIFLSNSNLFYPFYCHLAFSLLLNRWFCLDFLFSLLVNPFGNHSEFDFFSANDFVLAQKPRKKYQMVFFFILSDSSYKSSWGTHSNSQAQGNFKKWSSTRDDHFQFLMNSNNFLLNIQFWICDGFSIPSRTLPKTEELFE